MLDIVCWRWGTMYPVAYINRLQSMLRRHLHIPYRLHCITDDPVGLCHGIMPFPIWPSAGLGRARRLRIFDPSMRSVFGPRILQMDIDCVILADVTPLLDRQDPFVIWRSVPTVRYIGNTKTIKPNPENGVGAYNTSLVLMDAGVFPTLWTDYLAAPSELESRAIKGGLWTSICTTLRGKPTGISKIPPGDDDQAVISLYAREINPATWQEADGVYKFGRRGFVNPAVPPRNARIVFFNGSLKVNRQDRMKLDWIEENWR